MLAACAFAAAAAVASPVPSAPASATPNPYEIFARTRQYWESQRYPGMVDYTIAVTVVEGGKEKTERYHSGYDGYDGSIAFDPVSDYETAHPYYPHGINVGLPFVRLGKPEPLVDFLGVPLLAPNYAFGIGVTPLTVPPGTPSPAELVREVRAQFHDPDPRAKGVPAPQASPGLREIAVVASTTRTYQITLAGIDLDGGSPAYHLVLRPLRDPGRHRLRELWVDTASYAPRRLVEALNFVTGPGTSVPWSVSFARIGGSLYIDRETALAPLSVERHGYSRASVAFENLHEVARFSDDLSRFVPDDTLLMQEP